jgi:hypothetical protein
MTSRQYPAIGPQAINAPLLVVHDRRVGPLYTFQGKTQSISAWAREYRLSRSVLKHRLQRAQWPIEKALTLPLTPAALTTKVSKEFKG